MEAMLFIDNKAVPAKAGSYVRNNPMTGEVASRGPAASVDEACEAADSAARAFPAWAATAPAQRRAILLKAADMIEQRLPDFLEAQRVETGAITLLGHAGVAFGAAIFREAASMATQVAGETLSSDRPGVFSMTVRRPVGVCLSISPWNGAINLAVRAIAFPLAFGNTVVLKASEHCPTRILRGCASPKSVSGFGGTGKRKNGFPDAVNGRVRPKE